MAKSNIWFSNQVIQAQKKRMLIRAGKKKKFVGEKNEKKL